MKSIAPVVAALIVFLSSFAQLPAAPILDRDPSAGSSDFDGSSGLAPQRDGRVRATANADDDFLPTSRLFQQVSDTYFLPTPSSPAQQESAPRTPGRWQPGHRRRTSSDRSDRGVEADPKGLLGWIEGAGPLLFSNGMSKRDAGQFGVPAALTPDRDGRSTANRQVADPLGEFDDSPAFAPASDLFRQVGDTIFLPPPGAAPQR